MGRPNILWICTDQQRWDTLGCYGNRFVRTPALDRLAERGVVFEHTYSQSPVCTPSRACFLTGRYPRTTRCRQNGQCIPEDEVLITKLLADDGYECGLAGKLHLSACEPPFCREMEGRIDDGYSAFHWSHHAGAGWGVHNEYWAWLAERGATFQTQRHPESRWVSLGMPEELHQTTWCVEKALDFIAARRADGKPWLFSVNVYDPHHTFDPPQTYLDRYLPFLDEISLSNYTPGELASKSAYQAFDHEGAYGHCCGFPFDEMTPREHRLVRAAYWAMCDLIDAQVGRLITALEESGELANTIVIFMSDHGEMLGDHGVYLKGPYFYEPAVRVPLIVSWPERVRPQRSRALVELTDLAPTLLDAVGLPRYTGMQGRSLWPLLTGDAPADQHREDVYSEYYNAMPWHKDPRAHLTMVRTERCKLVVDHSGGGGELYDLKADPNESRNLWDDAEARDVKTEMLVRLCNRMAWTVDPLPPRVATW